MMMYAAMREGIRGRVDEKCIGSDTCINFPIFLSSTSGIHLSIRADMIYELGRLYSEF